MLAARPPYGTIILPAVSSMDELQLAQLVRSNISGPAGDAAARSIRMFKISGRVFMEMQNDRLFILSQGDLIVMQFYLKLQGKKLTGTLRERRRCITEIYPELGSEFPSIYGPSRQNQSQRQPWNRNSLLGGLTELNLASDHGSPGTSPILRPAGHDLAFDFDDDPVVNPRVQIRHHHVEPNSGHVTDGAPVGLGTLSEDVETERGVVTSRLNSHGIGLLSPLAQQDGLCAPGHGTPPPHVPSITVTGERRSEQRTPDDPSLEPVITLASASVTQPFAQRDVRPLECDVRVSHRVKGTELLGPNHAVNIAVPPPMDAMSQQIISIQGGDYKATSRGSSSISRQNTELATRPIEEMLSHTINMTPRQQDIPRTSLQIALTVRDEPSDQGTNNVHVDERSSILSCPSIDETPKVTEAACLELSGPSGVRTTHICDPVLKPTCALFPFDRCTEVASPLDLSAVIVVDDNEKKMSQNILCTPRAATADPDGKYTLASLLLDVGGISLGSPERSNSISLAPGTISNVSPTALTFPVYTQDQPVPLLSPDPPHGQIFRNKDSIYMIDTSATCRTQTPPTSGDPTAPSSHVESPALHVIEGGFNTRPQVLATSSASSRVSPLDLDIKTAAQEYHGMVSDPSSHLEADNGDIANSVSDVERSLNLSLTLLNSPEMALLLDSEATVDEQLPDHTTQIFDINCTTPGLPPDNPSMDRILFKVPDERTSIQGALNLDSIKGADPSPCSLDDLQYGSACDHTSAVIHPTNPSTSSVTKDPRHEDQVHGPDEPLFGLLPIASRFMTEEDWYSPTDSSEWDQLWNNIFGQAHANCREAGHGPTTEIKSCHMLPAIPSLYRQSMFYETTVHVRGDVSTDAGQSHEPEPASGSNNPVGSTHCAPLLRLDLPKSSLIEDLSPISPLLILPRKTCGASSPSAILSNTSFRRIVSMQRTLFPVMDGPHNPGLWSLHSERAREKDSSLPVLPIPPKIGMGGDPILTTQGLQHGLGTRTFQDIMLCYVKRVQALYSGESGSLSHQPGSNQAPGAQCTNFRLQTGN